MLHHFLLVDSIEAILLQNVEEVLVQRRVINDYLLVSRLTCNGFHDFWEILVSMNRHIIFVEVLMELRTGDFLFVDEKVNMVVGLVILMENHVGEK